jgi:hypothetical protein
MIPTEWRPVRFMGASGDGKRKTTHVPPLPANDQCRLKHGQEHDKLFFFRKYPIGQDKPWPDQLGANWPGLRRSQRNPSRFQLCLAGLTLSRTSNPNY